MDNVAGERLAARTELRTLQALRAIAALMVVAFHAVGHYDSRSPTPALFQWWYNGSAGVDIFFVISGIVITLSARRLQTGANGWWRFAVARVRRIVPMYWLVTAAKIGIILIAPALISRAAPLGWWHVLGSFLFIPVPDATGSDMPVVEVGWTLTYEMMFYALVALALFARASILPLTAVALGLFAACRFLIPDFGNTIVVEFLFGVAIASSLHRIRIPATAAVIMALVGFALICCVPIGSGVLRPITWGVPAALFVLGALYLEGPAGRLLPAGLLLLGDASYSLYLSHGFVIPVVYGVAKHVHLTGMSLMVTTLIGGLFASSVFAIALYYTAERPMLRWMTTHKSTKIRPPFAQSAELNASS